MGPRLLFGTFDDIRGRCDAALVRPTLSEPGYDDGALVPDGEWAPVTASDAEQLRADGTTPDSVLIELVHRPLPDLDPDDLEGRLETAARLNPLDGRWPTTLLGCAASPGNWATTTEDSATGRRIGLHVDNFDRLPYSRRHRGRRRLCLNLGPDPLRTLRIRLEPGDGYIAPTELLPHDGSTARIDQPSVAAFWLGRQPNAT